MAEKNYDLLNRGVVLKIQPGALQPGQLMSATNLDSFKEGSVCPRAGSRRFPGNNGNVWKLPHSLAKMVIGRGDAFDTRYVGEQANIWRVIGPYSTDVKVTTGFGLSQARWESAAYNSGSSGEPYTFFAHPSRMMKDSYTYYPLLRPWGIPPPVIPATCALPGGAGGPNGDYRYLYTFRNPKTGAEGNPCALMANAFHAASQIVRVTFCGADADNVTGDPEILGYGSVAIYRAGGTFGDGLYRFIGFGTNPGFAASVPLFDDFDDTISDLAIIDARTIEFDNYEPVTSDIPVPFVGTIDHIVAVGSFKRVYLKDYPNFVADPSLQTFFTPGSQVTIGDSTNQEVVTVFLVGTTQAAAANWIEVYLQNAHVADENVLCDANAAIPCDLVCKYQDALLVAGDPNNPHKVYRSKAGRPDAFPIVNLASGNSHVLNVGSPSDPIMGITEFDGEVVVLNQKSINVFVIFNGQMTQPQKSPADRGMVGKHCWASILNQIWFLSYDGIYSWAGGEATLRTEAILSIFNSASTIIGDQTYYPLDYNQLGAFHIEYFDQEVWITYVDVRGSNVCLRYQMLYDRWLPVVLSSTSPQGAAFGALMAERDTGRMIVGIQDNAVFNPGTGNNGAGFLQQMGVGSTDNWLAIENSGDQIEWALQTGFESPEGRTRLLQMAELVMEVSNPAMRAGDFINFNLVYDYATSIDPIDAFQLAAANFGKRRFVTFPLQQSGVDGAATGKEARSVSLVVFAKTAEHVEIFGWSIRYNPLEIPTRNSILDWQSLGTPNDKQLYVLDIEFDPNGQTIEMLLDVIAGVDGVILPAVQAITLRPAVATSLTLGISAIDLTISLASGADINIGTVLQIDFELVIVTSNPGANPNVQRAYLGTLAAAHAPLTPVYSTGRVKQTIPIVDNVICKSVRLRPVVPVKDYEIFSWSFDPKEDYPPDIVYFSPFTDNGNPYLKYIEQVVIECDTGGVTVQVNLEVDGAVVFTFPLNTNRFTRRQEITCPADITGASMRVLPQLPLAAGAKFQLWGVRYITEPADKGPVTHSYDWDDLGTPNDKQMQVISFEYDGSAGDITMAMDEMQGLLGGTILPDARTFVLFSNVRGKQTFAFPDGHIAKMVRVHPLHPPGGAVVPIRWKSWKYEIQKIDYPPDFVFFTDPVDNGSPYQKYVNQIVLEVDTGGQDVSVNLELDGVVVFTFIVNSTRLDRRRAATCPPNCIGVNMRILIANPLAGAAKFQLWGVKFITEMADRGPVTHTYDWDDMGTRNDKQLQTVSFEYDGSAGDIEVAVDELRGLDGGVPLVEAIKFRLLSNTRASQTFAFPDGHICKMFRIYPTTLLPVPLNFKSWKYAVQKIDFPPDYVLFTDLTDNGSPYLKFVNQVVLEVDTGGTPVDVNLELDGVVKFTFTVIATRLTRRQAFVCPRQISGVNIRIVIPNPPVNPSKFQLWNVSYVTEPADKAAVTHSYDWDDCGHPYDKKLQSIVFEYDGSAGDVTMRMETLLGINGVTEGAPLQFVLIGAGRAKQQFGIPDGNVVKMIRLSPQNNPNVDFKSWRYVVEKVNYPADYVLFTEKQTFDYACEKIARNLILDIDTGGVDATIQVFADGAIKQTVTINTSANDRSRIIALMSNLIGREWYLHLEPGVGGKTQLFSWNLDVVKEPCAVDFYDSYEQDFGVAGIFKWVKQGWVEYQSDGPIVLRIFVDGGNLLWTENLPAHPVVRDVERFYFPPADPTNRFLNKSKKFRFQISCESGKFKLYADSIIEFTTIGDGQRLKAFNLTERNMLPVV